MYKCLEMSALTGTKYFRQHILLNPIMAVLRIPPEQLRLLRGPQILNARDANAKCRCMLPLCYGFGCKSELTCRYPLYRHLAIDGLNYKGKTELPSCLVQQIRARYPDPGDS
jgi:hypothetical protein